MGEEIRVWKWSKIVEFPTFMGSWPWRWLWIRAWSLTFFHLSSSTTCIPNFIEIEETSCGRTDTRTDTRTDGNLPPIVLGWLPKLGSRPKTISVEDLVDEQVTVTHHLTECHQQTLRKGSAKDLELCNLEVQPAEECGNVVRMSLWQQHAETVLQIAQLEHPPRTHHVSFVSHIRSCHSTPLHSRQQNNKLSNCRATTQRVMSVQTSYTAAQMHAWNTTSEKACSRWMTLKVTQGHQNCCYYFLLVVCSHNNYLAPFPLSYHIYSVHD